MAQTIIHLYKGHKAFQHTASPQRACSGTWELEEGIRSSRPSLVYIVSLRPALRNSTKITKQPSEQDYAAYSVSASTTTLDVFLFETISSNFNHQHPSSLLESVPLATRACILEQFQQQDKNFKEFMLPGSSLQPKIDVIGGHISWLPHLSGEITACALDWMLKYS